MILKEAFDEFQKNKINLNQSRIDTIKKAHNTLRDLLSKDEEIKPRFYGSYLQGSYATGTAIKPGNGGEYDVDSVLAMDLEDEGGDLLDGEEVIRWIADRLRSYSTYKDMVEEKERCVRVNYAVDDYGFHVDIVPAHSTGDLSEPIRVPPDWSDSHPKGFIEWCRERRKICDHFYRIVRIQKFWRNIQLPEIGPKSMILMTLIGEHIPEEYLSVDDALVNTMESINDFLDENLVVPSISNPSLEEENLARDWTQPEYNAFKKRFNQATQTAIRACNSKDEEETIELWNSEELFDGEFPKQVRGLGEEAAEINENISKGKAFVGSSGLIGFKKPDRGGAKIKENKGFYGSD